MVIGIVGKMQSGKDTVGKIIQMLTDNLLEGIPEEAIEDCVLNTPILNPSFKIVKFADKLKDMVCLLIGCTREDLENDAFKDKELGEEWYRYGLIRKDSVKPIFFPSKLENIEGQLKLFKESTLYIDKLTPRKLLQLLGTECGRQIIHPNLWVLTLMQDYKGDTEIWKPIEDYEDSYKISSFGRVKSLDRKIVYGEDNGQYHTKKSQILKPTLSGGYETVSLSGKTFTVHSLVAKHFVEGYQEGFVVNHIDYNKTNNFYKNLEWITQEDNIKHNKTTLRGNFGERQKDAKLTDEKVVAIKKLLEDGTFSQKQISDLFEVSPTTISNIKKGRKWNHVGKDIPVISPIIPQEYPNWIITDVRFPNEVQAIKDRGGIIIKVMRDIEGRFPLLYNKWRETTYSDFYHFLEEKYPAVYSKITHESETALDGFKFDNIVYNDTSMFHTLLQVRSILDKNNICHKF